MPRKDSPTMQTLHPLLIWLLLPSGYYQEMDLYKEIPTDEVGAFIRLAEEQKQSCYRHSTCPSYGLVETSTIETNGTFVSSNFSSSTNCFSAVCRCCGSCTCDADCIRYGTCCLDVYRSFNHALQSTQNTRYGCVLAQYLPKEESDFSVGYRYWMIAKCDPNYPNMEIRDLCENPGLDGSPDSVVPVTDSRSHVHYRNKYCYYCNRVDKEASLIYWTLDIKNSEYIAIPNENLLLELKQQRGNIIFHQPKYVEVQSCDVPRFQISTCNKTGLWKTYNKYIERACSSFLDPFNYTYRNYFCYLCNAGTLPEDSWGCFIESVGGDYNLNPPFLAILDIAAVKSELARDQLHCGPDQFKDEIMMRCRDVLCHEDRKLENGACVPSRKRVPNATCFSAFIRMTPLSNSTFIFEDDKTIRGEIKHFLAKKLSICDGIENDFIIFYDANYFERVRYFVVFILTFMDTGCYNYIDKFMSLHSSNITVFDISDTPVDIGLEAAVYNIKLYNKQTTIFIPVLSSMTVTTLETTGGESFGNPCYSKELNDINRLFICPFIILSSDELAVEVKNDFLFIADDETPNKTLKTFSKWEYEIHGKQIYICLEEFMELYNLMYEHNFKRLKHIGISDPDNLKHNLALVCVSVSIACLFVTITTYVKHSSLQSQPGINNVILCIFLLLAQTMYQFGAGQTSLPEYICSLIGAMCHFLWLSVMFSMNTCCIQMFTIFRKQTKLSSKFGTWQTMKHVLYVTCASCLFVFINMVVSLVSSGGESIGYGGTICYLSSNLMQIITFVTPSALTLVLNIILFTYVVYMIKKVSSANLLAKERNYLGVYARLSTLTGLTWVFGLCRLVFETEVLEYLFIVFNAGQGVFIMTAFVLNKRVLSLIFRKSVFTSSETPIDMQTTRRETIN